MADLKQHRLTLPTSVTQKQLPGINTNTSQTHRPTIEQVVQAYSAQPGCVVLFDATGSMQPYWQNVQSAIREIVERLLNVGGRPRLKIVAYRDDCDGERIIEQSVWSSDAEELYRFISRIICDGGGDRPEAVDRALQVAAADQEAISGVVLIGDAPPHEGRDGRQEAETLGQAGRPVYPIVVGGASDTRQAFAEIARLSKGKMMELENLEELYSVLSVVLAHSLGKETFEKYLKQYQTRLTPGAQKAARLLNAGQF
jgi:Mg-chelatase subunit ChlD